MRYTHLIIALSLVASTFGMQAQAARIINTENVKAVNGVKWTKEKAIDAKDLVNQNIPTGATSVFFIRPQDNDGFQQSANIAINDRFQTSLQPGNYSQVYSCSGVNEISGEITGHKNNDLLKNALTFNLTSQDNYFFFVDVNEAGETTIKHITKESALKAMENMPHQAHQISRVVPNCPVEPVTRPMPVAPVTPPPPVAQQKYSIDLQVLFDTDKHDVKPKYMNRIAEVADFMKAHPTATANIEGHTDSRQTDEYNQALSQRRVNAVRKILIEQFGIAPDRLNAVGYGESRPIATNDTAEGRQQNRRVVAVFDNY
ncbi:OmpA family protein [Faucicola boevrei]|uniref:OmpA family protein n=1 Tax=Faucicola boevrei TaxID=346665 RepID=UPI00036A807F|nr:OmpA family protein [Moraxella boevrei]